MRVSEHAAMGDANMQMHLHMFVHTGMVLMQTFTSVSKICFIVSMFHSLRLISVCNFCREIDRLQMCKCNANSSTTQTASTYREPKHCWWDAILLRKRIISFRMSSEKSFMYAFPPSRVCLQGYTYRQDRIHEVQNSA